MVCKICSSPTNILSEATVLNKYKVSYYQCSNCGFVQMEKPYSLSEVYTEAINTTDVGLVKRNLVLADITNMAITFFFNWDKKFLDYGAGYGLFVRLMRDKGFDFYWQDNYCENLFAKSFEAGENENGFEMLTSFEVFEHLESPVEELGKMVNYSKNILFSTELFPANNPKPGEWWYYGLDHGQHIAFYTEKSLRLLAQKFNLNFYTNGKNIHLITEKRISPFLLKLISYPPIASFLCVFFSRKSLHEKDYEMVIGRMKSKG